MKRTKLSAPPPLAVDKRRPRGAGLPPELQDLVLAHFDIDELASARRNASQLVLSGLQSALARKIRACDTPGTCVAVYRGLYAEFYRQELRREDAHAAVAAADGGDEKKRAQSPEGKSGSGTETAGADVEAAENADTRLARKCATVCLTGTEAIEALLRAYMTDTDRAFGGESAPWQEPTAIFVVFLQAATESVGGDPLRVQCRLVRRYSSSHGSRWRMSVQLQITGTGPLAAYRAADLNAPVWLNPPRPPSAAPSKTRAQLSAFGSFLRQVLERAEISPPPSSSSSSSSPSSSARSEQKVGADVAVARAVTLDPSAEMSGLFDFVASGGPTTSAKATRAFARVLAATAYAFASVVTIEPSVNHVVTATQTRGSYVSPVPRHIRLLRDAFPTLPIRVLYRDSGQGRVYARSDDAASKTWRNLSVPEMVGAAIAAGVTDVAAVRLA